MIVVVAAAIVRDGRVLAARRTQPANVAGRWELPGGKVDPGETDEQALAREIREELGIEIVVGERIPGEWPLHDDYVLRAYAATIASGEPAALDHHDKLRWLTRDELDDVPWLGPDREAVGYLPPFADANCQ